MKENQNLNNISNNYLPYYMNSNMSHYQFRNLPNNYFPNNFVNNQYNDFEIAQNNNSNTNYQNLPKYNSNILNFPYNLNNNVQNPYTNNTPYFYNNAIYPFNQNFFNQKQEPSSYQKNIILNYLYFNTSLNLININDNIKITKQLFDKCIEYFHFLYQNFSKQYNLETILLKKF